MDGALETSQERLQLWMRVFRLLSHSPDHPVITESAWRAYGGDQAFFDVVADEQEGANSGAPHLDEGSWRGAFAIVQERGFEARMERRRTPDHAKLARIVTPPIWLCSPIFRQSQFRHSSSTMLSYKDWVDCFDRIAGSGKAISLEDWLAQGGEATAYHAISSWGGVPRGKINKVAWQSAFYRLEEDLPPPEHDRRSMVSTELGTARSPSGASPRGWQLASTGEPAAIVGSESSREAALLRERHRLSPDKEAMGGAGSPRAPSPAALAGWEAAALNSPRRSGQQASQLASPRGALKPRDKEVWQVDGVGDWGCDGLYERSGVPPTDFNDWKPIYRKPIPPQRFLYFVAGEKTWCLGRDYRRKLGALACGEGDTPVSVRHWYKWSGCEFQADDRIAITSAKARIGEDRGRILDSQLQQ